MFSSVKTCFALSLFNIDITGQFEPFEYTTILYLRWSTWIVTRESTLASVLLLCWLLDRYVKVEYVNWQSHRRASIRNLGKLLA